MRKPILVTIFALGITVALVLLSWFTLNSQEHKSEPLKNPYHPFSVETSIRDIPYRGDSDER